MIPPASSLLPAAALYVDNIRLKFLFINLSQVKVSVHKFKLGKCCTNSEAF